MFSLLLLVYHLSNFASTLARIAWLQDLPSEFKKKNKLKKMCASRLASEFPKDCNFDPADTRDELHQVNYSDSYIILLSGLQ